VRDVEHCRFGDDASGPWSNKLAVDYTGSCVDVVAVDDAFGDFVVVVVVMEEPCDDKCFVEDWATEAVVCWGLAWDLQAIVDDA